MDNLQIEDTFKIHKQSLDLHEDKITALQKENLELSARVKSLEELVEELLEKQTSAPVLAATPGLKGIEYKIGKDKYKLKFPRFSYEGNEYDEETLLANPALVAALVKSCSKMLVKV